MAKPSCHRPTEAQNAARSRAWRIFRLRGLHSQLHMLTGLEKEIALTCIDIELSKLGAESESKRQDEMRRRYQEIEE